MHPLLGAAHLNFKVISNDQVPFNQEENMREVYI